MQRLLSVSLSLSISVYVSSFPPSLPTAYYLTTWIELANMLKKAERDTLRMSLMIPPAIAFLCNLVSLERLAT